MYTKTKYSLVTLTFVSICYSQGMLNGYGLGHYYRHQGLKNAIDGISWIAPSNINDVSLSNPSTWHNLDYTHLSISYGGSENILQKADATNGYSGLTNVVWLTPIKKISSIGFVLEPYVDQRVNIVDLDTSYFDAFDTTYNLVRGLSRHGGIMSIKLGSSFKLNEKISFGLFNNILFGSARTTESIFFDGSPILKTSRVEYDGLISELFLSFDLFDNTKVYSHYSHTLRPLSATIQKKYLFDDTNQNGYHDYSVPGLDFPIPDSVSSDQKIEVGDLHAPKNFSFSVLKYYKTRLSGLIEFGNMRDDWKSNNFIKFPNENRISSSNYLKMGLTTYPKNYSIKLLDKILINAGLIFYEHKLDKKNMNVRELGYSMSIGFKFKPLQNQIGLSYYHGSRSYSNIDEKESVKQIQLGISLADIWYVKRRQK